jgi:hypothetical protein
VQLVVWAKVNVGPAGGHVQHDGSQLVGVEEEVVAAKALVDVGRALSASTSALSRPSGAQRPDLLLGAGDVPGDGVGGMAVEAVAV